MFRGFIPALTLFVFCVGLGIGFCWSCGLIPLTYAPAKSGSLSAEYLQREELPPPNESDLTLTAANHARSDESRDDDPEVFENQSEPEVDAENAAKRTMGSINKKPSQREFETSRDDAGSWDEGPHAQKIIRPAAQESSRPVAQKTIRPAAQETNRSTDASTEPPSRSFRLRRDRVSSRVERTSTDEEPVETSRSGKVRVAAHQAPDSSGDARDGNSSSRTPREQLTAAEEKLAAGETLAAHREFSKLYWNHKELRPQMQETIDSTAKAIFFQSRPHYIEPYVIQEGDRLEAIAKKYQLSWEYLAKLNRTEPRRIQIGQKLKVVKGPFGAVVDLKEFALIIHLQGYYVKRYSVGVGKDGSSPVGKFPVLNKVENPQYTAPNGKVIASDDPSNPLGERWIDLGESYGIHGTVDPESIGKAESRGCIRLRDSDIIEVYDFLVKGSEVVLKK